jgi:hypothetical protein
MAIQDINFTEGENQLFTVEIPVGNLNAPADTLIEPSTAFYPLLEIEEQTGNIFIIPE